MTKKTVNSTSLLFWLWESWGKAEDNNQKRAAGSSLENTCGWEELKQASPIHPCCFPHTPQLSFFRRQIGGLFLHHHSQDPSGPRYLLPTLLPPQDLPKPSPTGLVAAPYGVIPPSFFWQVMVLSGHLLSFLHPLAPQKSWDEPSPCRCREPVTLHTKQGHTENRIARYPPLRMHYLQGRYGILVNIPWEVFKSRHTGALFQP